MSLLLLAALAAAPALPARCRLDEPASAQGLLDAEARWVAAIEARDVAALACRLAPGFVDISWRGEPVARDTVLARLPARAGSRLVLTELRAEVHGRLGIVTGLNTQTTADGSVVGSVRFTDVFVRGAGGWRALHAQETVVPG